MPQSEGHICSCGAERNVYIYGVPGDYRVVIIQVKDVKRFEENYLHCPFCGKEGESPAPKEEKAKTETAFV
jgi:hypothetical protein